MTTENDKLQLKTQIEELINRIDDEAALRRIYLILVVIIGGDK